MKQELFLLAQSIALSIPWGLQSVRITLLRVWARRRKYHGEQKWRRRHLREADGAGFRFQNIDED